MSLFALASAKSSPGVTTACLALSAVWPAGRDVRIVEADADGGTLAARFGLAAEPGLSTLAVASRRSLLDDELTDHSQPLPGGGVSVVVAPPTAEQVARSLSMLGEHVASHLRAQTGDTLIDVGRLRPGTPAWPLVETADAVLLVARPRVEELQQLPARVRSLRGTPGQCGILLVGDRPYPPSEVAAALDTEVIGVLAEDPSGAAAIIGQGSHHKLARSPLLRSARDVTDVLVAWTGRLVAADAPASDSSPADTPAEVAR